ncbi:MAG: S8 family serine peptidase [Thermoplasmata archaeon]|nr:MAG: S8 family serine peptidase [Thermoplasmata archaeon]
MALILSPIPNAMASSESGRLEDEKEMEILKFDHQDYGTLSCLPDHSVNKKVQNTNSDQILLSSDNLEGIHTTQIPDINSPMHIHLNVASFDPLLDEPYLAKDWIYNSENSYFLIQCKGPIQPGWLDDIRTSGAIVLGYIPNYTYLVYLEEDAKKNLETLPFIRWTGIYHPVYKIQKGLSEKEGDIELNVWVFENKEVNLISARDKLRTLGGTITEDGEENNIIRVRIDASMIRNIAFIPEVEWIDEYSPPSALMDNVRDFTGAETLHINGFNGTGIVGEVKDNGFDEDHPDFEGQIIGTDGNPVDDAHGTCTFGIVFSSGANNDIAEGMLPQGAGVFADWGVGRTTSIDNLVNNWEGVFQSNSWFSGYLDSTYTSFSRENDQIVFDYDVVMLYGAGNSNYGVYSESCSQDSVAKNVICVGAVFHYNDADRTNDEWVNYGQYSTPSQGPASDGRVKPDLAGVFDWIYTTDSVDGDGENGYATGNYFNDMGGTSGATPIAAGSAGLVYQMYMENYFGNNPSQAMPHAATVKAILIADAYQYDFSQADRYQQGWGLVDVGNVYDIGQNHFIVDEDESLETGGRVTYNIIPTGNDPLKISLVWTDVPGTTSSSQHLVNNLNLRVTDPNNEVYWGNAGLLTSKWSSSGGSSDTLNNVENVFIENPTSGVWTIEVIAQNIAMDGNPDTPDVDQNFAVVASGVTVEHDIYVSDMIVPNYVRPNQQTHVNATVSNIGSSDETGLIIKLNVNGNQEATKTISSLNSGDFTLVSFLWTAPSLEGDYLLEIISSPLTDEYNINNNRVIGKITVATGAKLGRIGLISDVDQLQIIAPIVDGLGKSHDILNNNIANKFTSNITLLLKYQLVIFYNDERAISDTEYQVLEDYLTLGGVLLVTGYDSLGSPDDANLADIVRSSAFGDNSNENMFVVLDGSHPMMEGGYGQFSTGNLFSLSETDHDMAEADDAEGAKTIAELSDGYDKIIATELPQGAKVIYWNGNRNCLDWTEDEDLKAMLKNLITWIMPIYNDVGILSITNPSESFVGDTVDIVAKVMNHGRSDQSGFDVILELNNAYGFTIHSETKQGVSIDSWKNESLIWQLNLELSGYYTIKISSLLANDEAPANDVKGSLIHVYYRFFYDDIESGVGDWDVSASSPVRPPLWHQTDSESHSPDTSWWCGEDVTNQYTVLADQYLTSPVIDLNDTTSAYLRFYHQYSIDDFPLQSDWGYVEINPGGTGWETLDSFRGTWMTWDLVLIDISNYVGEQIQIRFTLESGVVLTDNGWWVDDVEIFGMKNQYLMNLSVNKDEEHVGKDESAFFRIYVRNTGNALGTFELSFTGINIEDWLVSFDQNNFDLLPGDFDMVTLTITPVSAEQGYYFITVTGSLIAEGEIKAIDTLPLTVNVTQWYGVDLVTQGESLYFIPSESNNHIITVSNQGNGPDTFSFSTQYIVSGNSDDWQFYLNITSIDLDAFSEKDITLFVTAPSDGLPGDSIKIDVKATSVGDVAFWATTSTTSVVTEYFSIDVTSSQPVKETEPGVPASHSVTLKNLGNTNVNVNLDIEPTTGNWDNWIPFLSSNTISLNAFSDKVISFKITPPFNLLAYKYKDFDITAISTGSFAEFTIRTQIALSGGLDIDVDAPEKFAKNSETASYVITVGNEQNQEDTLDITAYSTSGWQVSLFDSHGIIKLSDTDSDGDPDTGKLDPLNGVATIVAQIEVPDDANAFYEEKATITFASSLPNGSVETIVLTCIVEISGDIVIGSDSNSKIGDPDSHVSYLLSVTNHFNYRTTIDITASSFLNFPLAIFQADGKDPLEDTDGSGIPDCGMLDAFGGSKDIMIVLTLPESAVAYTADVITVTGVPSISRGDSYLIQLNASVARVHDIEISLESGELKVTSGEELVFTVKLQNSGNFDEDLNILFDELPNDWRASFSVDNPQVPMGKSRIITVNMDIPKDAKSGEYRTTIFATSDDGVEVGYLTLTIEVEKGGEESELPYLLLIIIILVICAIIVATLVLKKTGQQEQAQKEVLPISALPAGYKGMIFPTLETISCPDCQAVFEVEAGIRPLRVQCPRCGVSGTLR